MKVLSIMKSKRFAPVARQLNLLPGIMRCLTEEINNPDAL